MAYSNKEDQKAWRESHAEYLKEYFRQYRKQNKDKIKEYNKTRDKEKQKARNKARYEKTKSPEKNREQHLKRRYNITNEDYTKMYLEQGGLCAICGISKEILHIDHNHTTGEIRGLLCGHCNRGLGLFFDSENNLLDAISYLKKHNG